MSYEEAKAHGAKLENAVAEASNALRAIPGLGSGRMGLTPDAIKSTPEFKVAKDNYNRAFTALRKFNQGFIKEFKKEILADRDAKRKEKANG
jgi:hypothetical protein